MAVGTQGVQNKTRTEGRLRSGWRVYGELDLVTGGWGGGGTGLLRSAPRPVR